MSASIDGSEDVDQFLARIASLSKKTGSEDAERTRRTEEQMLQAKKERQARRAERARSLSPSKTGPAAPLSSPSTRSPMRERLIDPPITLEPQTQAQPLSFNRAESPTRTGSIRPLSSFTPGQTRSLPQPPQQSQISDDSPSSRPSSSAGLSRSGTLSWQQRPLSRGIGSGFGSVRSRPLSGSRATSREPPESPRDGPSDQAEETPSRGDIAAALGTRDPSWFRQTQDRGLNSAAYRKSAHDDAISPSHPPHGLRLPGMGDGKNRKDPISLPAKQLRDDMTHDRGSRSVSPRRNTAAAYVVNQGLAPSVPSLSPTEPSQEHTSSDVGQVQQDAESALGRSGSVLAGRPPSPTKGLGGFVQSAMMRRSDSVSKRWSVQANAGLKRGDSAAGNKPNFSFATPTVPSLGHARTLSRDTREPREGTQSPQTSSRPGSSHAAQPDVTNMIQKSQSEPHGLVAPLSKRASVDVQAMSDEPRDDEPNLTRSPSKTLDPRRWSPTKASWLESALSKPESPRFSPTKEEAPPWKLDMQRSKSNKDLAEFAKKTIPHEPVSTPSLLRSPPPTVKAKPLDLPVRSKASEEPKRVESEIAPKADSSTLESLPPVGAVEAQDTIRDRVSAQPQNSIATSSVTQPDGKSKPATASADTLGPSTERKPPALKPKPDTPPKTDFRATLKSRTAPNPKSTEEPEFKAIFGKLKKSQTQNYVAPDIFKDNITRGKAALNNTGGPQPRKRVDEFKESILAQKQAMQAGGGSIHQKSQSREASPAKAEQALPEALQRRNTLHRSKASADDKPAVDTKVLTRSPPPIVQSKTKPSWMPTQDVKAKTTPAPTDRFSEVNTSQDIASRPKTLIDEAEKDDPPKVSTTSKSSTGLHNPQDTRDVPTEKPFGQPAETRGPLQKDKPTEQTHNAHQQTSSVRTPSHAKGMTGPTPPAPTGLAARLNPALAGLIARGSSPKPANDESTQSSTRVSDAPKGHTGASLGDNAENLTHMTKGRAKGPKRKAPKASTREPITEKAPSPAAVVVSESVANPLSRLQNNASEAPQTSPTRSAFNLGRDVFSKKPDSVSSPAAPSPKPLKLRDSSTAAKSSAASTSDSPEIAPLQSPNVTTKVKSPPPVVASKSPELRRVSGQASPLPPKSEPSPTKFSSKKSFAIATDNTSQNSTSISPPASKAVDSATAHPAPTPLTPSRKTATANKTVGPSGLGAKLHQSTQNTKGQEFAPLPQKSTNEPKQSGISDAAEPSPLRTAILSLYSAVPRGNDKADFDTEAILSAKSNHIDRIKTISNQIWEISGDGKKTPLPQQQEHVLFEDSLYLIVHCFESGETIKKITECYLWTGDAVSASTAEDAQLFCRKIAREHGAKLDVVKQGKENSNFFAALGGIVVFRRSKASALYMLCGRRHLGHVTFDEVDCSPSALCSGFSYLISAKFGKLYLWKGQGSAADEIGAARLIGMDLGLTGEIEEVAEGKEPAAFWECFSSTSSAKSHFKPSDIWAMRSMDEKKGFPCKLYRLEPERPKSSGGGFWGLRATSPSKESNKMTLSAIEPFVQADVEEGASVHVLDAWASIYVIPGIKSKAADFVTALHIAQELAVLTPSMQDRALLPSCEVILGGVPSREVRAAFRKYVVDPKQKEGKVFEVAEVLSALD